MSKTNEILAQDLRILETMAASLEAYLASDATHWPMGEEGMPKLTIGGCLMRQERLQRLRGQLDLADQGRLDKTMAAFETLINNQVVRFEKRATDEVHARLREWMAYLRGASSKMAANRDYYATVVDTRIVMAALMNKLGQRPFQLPSRLAADVEKIDARLKGHWQPGEFILDAIWQPAYPVETYWWLFGYPL